MMFSIRADRDTGQAWKFGKAIRSLDFASSNASFLALMQINLYL